MKYWLGLARDWLLALAVVFSAYVVFQFVTSPTARSNGPAPHFALPDLEGNTFDLAEHDGLVVLNFWFTDCPPCRREIPEISRWAKRNPDIPVIGVSTDRLPTTQLDTRSRQLGIPYTVVHDQDLKVSQDYGVAVFPTTMVLKDGEIRKVAVGEVDQTSLENMVSALR